jgi:exopolyphosphatase/guanosine-5'-triphosphate,3'-diphosphate pyrophosphatase
VRVLEEARVRARLASGERGALNPASIDQSLRAATRFLKRAEHNTHARSGDLRVLAVATASVRDAPNSADLVDLLPALGVTELRILSGIEEAELGAEAALRTQPLHHGAVIDLGGGSMQWNTVRAGRLKHSLSLPLGAARMTREFIRHDPPQLRELEQLRAWVREQLAQSLPDVRPRGRMIALGGTARALARRHLRLAQDRPSKRRAATLSLNELARLRARLEQLSTAERKRLRGMRAERADIVVAGALVLETLLEQSGYDAFTVCNASVREAVLWREARRLRRSDD